MARSARGWTWVEGHEPSEEEANTPLQNVREDAIKQLVNSWNEQQDAIDAEGYRRERIRDGEDDGGPDASDFDTEAEWDKYLRDTTEARARPALQQKVIEEQLAAFGVRLMRPYEHWNEEEKLMEYLENPPGEY